MLDHQNPTWLREYVRDELRKVFDVEAERVSDYPIEGPFTDAPAMCLFWRRTTPWERDVNFVTVIFEARLFPQYVGEPDREVNASQGADLEALYVNVNDRLKTIAYEDERFYFELVDATPNIEQWSLETTWRFYTRNPFLKDTSA